MSEPEEAAILVVRGRWPVWLAPIGPIVGFAVPPLTVVGVLTLARESPSTRWVAGTAVGKILGAIDAARDSLGLGLALVAASVVFVGAGVASMIAVAGYVSRRAGAVAIHTRGIAWGPVAGAQPTAIPWENLAGFRDTPHPWVEVVDRKGRRRTFPAPSEPERLELTTTLARFLPDLGLPPDERSEPRA